MYAFSFTYGPEHESHPFLVIESGPRQFGECGIEVSLHLHEAITGSLGDPSVGAFHYQCDLL